jgi:hypothetical protein
LRQLLWHRHRMVRARMRMMNQLQAVALNEGLRCKKKLWREPGREQLESIGLAPWASRRREDLMELLDRLNPTIAELTQAIEQEAEKCPLARRLMTHPGVGALTGLRADYRRGRTISVRQTSGVLFGIGALGGLERRTTSAGAYQSQAGQFSAAILVSGSGASYESYHSTMAQ